MRISDWSSDVCSSDLHSPARYQASREAAIDGIRRHRRPFDGGQRGSETRERYGRNQHRSPEDRASGSLATHQITGEGPAGPVQLAGSARLFKSRHGAYDGGARTRSRSEEHTSELQSLMRISYAVFCLKKKKLKSIQYYDVR